MESNIKDLIKEIKRLKNSKTVWSTRTARRLLRSTSLSPCSASFVQAKTRKLKTECTTEMAYDISQYSGIDSSIEEQLINTLLKELVK